MHAATPAPPRPRATLRGLRERAGTVKYGFPLAAATALLAWGLVEFPGGYAGGNLAAAQGALRWATDYMLACRLGDANGSFVAQVAARARGARAPWARHATPSFALLSDAGHSGGSAASLGCSGPAASLRAGGVQRSRQVRALTPRTLRSIPVRPP